MRRGATRPRGRTFHYRRLSATFRAVRTLIRIAPSVQRHEFRRAPILTVTIAEQAVAPHLATSTTI
jgi:hypothetical protein